MIIFPKVKFCFEAQGRRKVWKSWVHMIMQGVLKEQIFLLLLAKFGTPHPSSGAHETLLDNPVEKTWNSDFVFSINKGNKSFLDYCCSS